jgi:hypothetical protein
MPTRWADLDRFRAEDPRRRGPSEVEYGSRWLMALADDPWRVCWVEATGELVAVQHHPGRPDDDGPVELLARADDRSAIEAGLQGWWQMCGHLGSLPWIRHRAAEINADAGGRPNELE